MYFDHNPQPSDDFDPESVSVTWVLPDVIRSPEVGSFLPTFVEYRHPPSVSLVQEVAGFEKDLAARAKNGRVQAESKLGHYHVVLDEQ
jgi:hypothetical protein